MASFSSIASIVCVPYTLLKFVCLSVCVYVNVYAHRMSHGSNAAAAAAAAEAASNGGKSTRSIGVMMLTQ